ncbi:MAG: hypothetical protein HONBIEJF_02807 [Fimbriimonadaceae bacterium]|nr:hypothetical protein [Fimbriimonadaceae bacterium]
MILAIAIGVIATFGDEAPRFFEGTGPHRRTVQTSSKVCQRYFDQGLNFLYAFNHGEAERSFRGAVAADPKCAMAYWGVAMANGPHINNMSVVPEDEKEGVEFLAKARKHMSGIRSADKDLILAATKRFAWPQPADRTRLNIAYANAMRKLFRRHRKDADVGALFAESMMDLRPWDLWRPDYTAQPGTQEVVRALEQTIKLNPKHPLALHLYIHAVEASADPHRAVDEADRLRDLQPGLGHNVHMPSHIDVRIGAWEKAIVSNAKAIEADRKYREIRPRQGIYHIYMAHNAHMLAYAAIMSGQSKKAIEAVDGMVAAIPEDASVAMAPFVDGFYAMPIEVRKRFGQWDEVLAAPEPAARFPLARAMRFAARATAFAAKGQPAEARAEQGAFYEARLSVPQSQGFGNNRAVDLIRVATHLMNGEILIAEGNIEGAIAHLRAGMAAEDKLRYSEPPDWIQPVRHTLGALLVREGRYQEAIQVYREDLGKWPNNGWSLYGMAMSLKGVGDQQGAAKYENAFAKTWSRADVPITSSCLCVPGK